MERILLALLASLLLSGCTTPTVDWHARVGHYTRDQAITDFGPPDKSTKLTDGTVMDEWLTQPSRVVVAPEPYFLPPGSYFGPSTPVYTETYLPADFLRLTFGPDGKLTAWKSFAK
ncbi:MAG TPA: hypothetical protein VMJ12_14510 [Candidatus Acidoferrales bacterium]|nr:hypothetical protein [Candidatus Acidoferrales bacterium]